MALLLLVNKDFDDDDDKFEEEKVLLFQNPKKNKFIKKLNFPILLLPRNMFF